MSSSPSPNALNPYESVLSDVIVVRPLLVLLLLSPKMDGLLNEPKPKMVEPFLGVANDPNETIPGEAYAANALLPPLSTLLLGVPFVTVVVGDDFLTTIPLPLSLNDVIAKTNDDLLGDFADPVYTFFSVRGLLGSILLVLVLLLVMLLELLLAMELALVLPRRPLFSPERRR